MLKRHEINLIVFSANNNCLYSEEWSVERDIERGRKRWQDGGVFIILVDKSVRYLKTWVSQQNPNLVLSPEHTIKTLL